MKILANENCNINDYCGIIMLTYLHVDKDKAEEIGKWLTNAGYSFVKNEISPITLLSGSYCEKHNKLLENCGCYIFPITENFNEYYRPLINVILYQIGVLESINKKRILPVRYRKNELSRKEIEDLLAKQNYKKAE